MSKLAEKLISAPLRPIYTAVVEGRRISDAECLALYRSHDVNGLGMIANVLRERKNGNVGTFIHNLYINYSNVCLLRCQFCAFGARKSEAHAFESSIEELVEKVRVGVGEGITEVHMVGGLHPTLPAEWYIELIERMRALDAGLFIKAFTAVEVRHLAMRVFKKSIPETLEALRRAGLSAITGGGAEILPDGARADLPGERDRRGVGGRASDVARDGDAEHGDDALWPHRDLRTARGSPAAFAGVAG